MALFNRLGKQLQANVNDWLQGKTDPEVGLEQAIVAMEQQLSRARQELAMAIATYKRLERQQQHAQQLADHGYQKAQQALNLGNQNLAKEWLQQRHGHLQATQETAATLTQGKAIATQLKQDLRVMERETAQAKTQQQLYLARARAATATHQMQMLTGRCLSNQTNAFERMEQRVRELEALAELGAARKDDELLQKITALETQGQIEAELAQLKSQQSPAL